MRAGEQCRLPCCGQGLMVRVGPYEVESDDGPVLVSYVRCDRCRRLLPESAPPPERVADHTHRGEAW